MIINLNDIKKTGILFLLLIVSFSTFAQKEIKGRVLTEKERKPIVAATVTLHPLNSQNILAYTVASDDGSFTLKYTRIPDSVSITVRAMNIEPQTKIVKSDIRFVEFIVHEKVNELKEVLVKAPKIRQLGDTINYDVASFTDATDRSIGDVLKKLPGVQVLSSGQILYQNKAISKFYIEGLDMLKGKYGIATNNVDASKVATVQVLENHQPIKVLKDMKLPEAAAINLKLKSSAKGAFFATAQLGAGLPAWLLSNELVGMRFTHKQQNMLVYKGDNTGRDVAQELIRFYSNSRNQGREFLSLQMPAPPSVNKQHYLFNNAHTASLNDLRVIKKGLTLTGNIDYLDDKQKSHSYAKNEIFLSDAENIHIQETTDAHLHKRELEGMLTLEGNTDSYFLNNELRVQSKWNDRHSELLPISNDPVTQFLELPEFRISNNFNYVMKKGEKRYRMESFVGYVTQRQALQVMPSLFAPMFSDRDNSEKQLQQQVNYDHLTTDAYISGEINKDWSLWMRAGVFTNHYNLKSNLFAGKALHPITPDSVRNDFARHEYGIKLQPSFFIKLSSDFKPQFSFPITYLWINRHNSVHKNNHNKGYFLTAPSLYMDYAFNARVSTSCKILFANNIGTIDEDYSGYIMSTYRTMQRSEGMESKQKRIHSYINLKYKNPFTTLFASTTLSYNHQWNNLLRDIRYNGILSSVTGIEHPHTTRRLGVQFRAGQSIDAIRSEVNFSTGYNISQSLAMHQGTLSDIYYQSFEAGTFIVTNIGRYMIAKYSINYHHGHNHIAKKAMPVMHSYSQNISTSIIPIKKVILNISFNHYYNNLLVASARSMWFGNASIKYKMKSADIILDWNNIFNTRQFINSSYSDVSSYYSEYRLRPSEVLLRVRFKIF